MLKLKLIKQTLLILLVLLATSVNSFAAKKANVEVNFSEDELLLTTPETIKNTTFKRFNDLWIIYSKKNLELNLSKEKLLEFGVTNFEKIITKNGSGYRLRFKNTPPSIDFLHDYDKRTMSIHLTYKELKNKKADTIKFRVKNVKEDTSLKQLFLDATYILDYAYSLQTGEKYTVAISNDTRFRYPTKQINQQLYFLPTYSGAVIISEKGEFLKILDEEVLQLVDLEDKFFTQAAADFSTQKLDSFFYNTGISLIERQVRDYSKFNRDVENFKSSGEYKNALNQLNNALSSIDKLDFLKDSQTLNGSAKRLEEISLQESEIFDMSGEDDGMFELEEQAKQELNDSEDNEQEVLVPDFSSDNLTFLMEKLRLSSIKQSGLFQKEKITLKRMQISAFKGYYHEILDLTKMLRLDISGEFPKGNKGLALYTLANAKLGRCRNIIPLPEKAGNIYTKDIRLWKAYCMVNQKKFESALTLFKRDAERIQTYPKKLQDELTLSYAVALRNTDNYKHSTALLKELDETGSEHLKERIKFILASNYLYQNESGLAEKEFKKLVFAKNLNVKYMARLEYLNILLQDKENRDKQTIIAALDQLRFDYRNNDTELEATKTLASLYLQEDYLKKAMELYKYISIYYSKTPSAKQATEILFNVFYNLFAKNQVVNSNMDGIARLAIFYDFIELTPSDYEGNVIISNVVADLIELGLYNNAIKLLTIQLNYKTRDEDIAQSLGEKLAELYLKTSQLRNAKKTLKLTQKFSDPKDYTAKARLIIANILIRQNKVSQAEKILETLNNNLQAKYSLAEIYWNENNYAKIIAILESIFLGKQVELDEQGIINLSYLMVAYSLDNNIEKLQQIKDLYLPELKKVDLEHKLEFLMKLAGADIKIKQEDNKLLDVWQDVIRIDNKSIDFMKEYNEELEFRDALVSRDYKTLEKYKSKLN